MNRSEEYLMTLAQYPPTASARVLYGTWVSETVKEQALHELAETYHTGCENYDRRVCSVTHPTTGEAIPLTPDEMRLINRHAQALRVAMIREGERLGLTREQVIWAIRDYL